MIKKNKQETPLVKEGFPAVTLYYYAVTSSPAGQAAPSTSAVSATGAWMEPRMASTLAGNLARKRSMRP